MSETSSISGKSVGSDGSDTRQNKAAFQMTQKATSLEVHEAPYTSPAEHQITIRNRALAINPIDWYFQQLGNGIIFQWLKYPAIMGYDVAGEVVEVGEGVSRFRVGDRVFGLAAGHDDKINRQEEAGAQLYTVLRDHMVAKVPDYLSYEQASVIPLGAATAAAGLFQEDQLNLELPSLDSKPKGKTVIIWAGSSSVGASAIQLATAAGYDVITTCSPKNFDFVKRLGASEAFDYKSKTVVCDMVSYIKDKEVAGALSIGDGAIDFLMDIMFKVKGNKFISIATKSRVVEPTESFALPKLVYEFASFHSSLWIKSKTRGIGYKLIFADSVVHDKVGKAIFDEYLPAALAQKKYAVMPEPMVTGHGLESIQEAYEIQRKGVSAKKVVVTL